MPANYQHKMSKQVKIQARPESMGPEERRLRGHGRRLFYRRCNGASVASKCDFLILTYVLVDLAFNALG
jgi:hypothetical protein